MPFTTQVSISSTSPTQILAKSNTTGVRVMENRGVAGWPTTDLLVFKGNSAVAVRIPAGSSYTFAPPYEGCAPIGFLLGSVQAVAGSTTLDWDEL